MTAAPSPDKSSEFLPETARQAIYLMRTQPRSIRVTYMVEPATFACAVLAEAAAVLAEAAAILAHSGAGLAVKADAVGKTAAAALAHCSPSEK